MPGDEVEIKMHDRRATIEDVLPRRNLIERASRRPGQTQPLVANIDRCLVFFSADRPRHGCDTIDQFLVSFSYQDIPVSIVFNKWDLADSDAEQLFATYVNAGYTCVKLQVLGQPEIARHSVLSLEFKRLYVCGPSGVGKSTLINLLSPGEQGETGEVGAHSGHGRHTTTAIQFKTVSKNRYIVDSPGLSYLPIDGLKSSDLRNHYPEIAALGPECRYRGCLHREEPGCRVREVYAESAFAMRYISYLQFLEKLELRRRY